MLDTIRHFKDCSVSGTERCSHPSQSLPTTATLLLIVYENDRD